MKTHRAVKSGSVPFATVNSGAEYVPFRSLGSQNEGIGRL